MGKNAIGLGVVGLGRAFTLMLPTFTQDERIRLVAGTDPRESARLMFSKDFNANAYSTIDELCADPAVEVVYIASPHQFHAAHVRIAAAAGKHILVEKPLAIDIEDCTAIVNAIDASSVGLIVGHSHSFNGPVLHARRLLQSGEFGAVHMLNSLNYTDFLYRPRRPEELDTRLGGGVVFSQAAHQIDIIRLLGGGLVQSVRACTGQWDPGRPTESAYSALLTFDNGAFASVTYSGYGHYDSDELLGNIGEMGIEKNAAGYGAARKKLAQISSPAAEATLKAAGNYGGANYQFKPANPARFHQHFGHLVVSASNADLRLTPEGVVIYSDEKRYLLPTPKSRVPRAEVIDEVWNVVRDNAAPTHGAAWARATTEVCLAILKSAETGTDIKMQFQVRPS
ncbi:4,5-dihydroxyphthalate dehydrogenase [Advenella kashmirensis W13003]|uniref:4,5-dihydroxyphthalate dehydrogenase n=1 Tax=Advenella kashmirensis W13003 TaxID=1424334 RepID=V8QNM7_9BURK|nr:Gfo/Idh/MocA family oxidoreductase [Advenella kashmirensis]ETF01556.1 4,5-dihydroxyphthalate dehydrogenase [Advenella kashmirensis W13003]